MARFLIADDSISVQKYLKSILSQYGTCDEALNGQQAVEMFQASVNSGSRYDLAVIDIIMPLMDGVTVLKEIIKIQDETGIQEEDRTKVIILSSLKNAEQIEEAVVTTDTGGVYITKPFDDKTFNEALINLGIAPNPIDNIEVVFPDP